MQDLKSRLQSMLIKVTYTLRIFLHRLLPFVKYGTCHVISFLVVKR